MVRLEYSLQEAQGLQRLSQIMTCGGQKAGLGLIGQLSRFARARNRLGDGQGLSAAPGRCGGRLDEIGTLTNEFGKRSILARVEAITYVFW